MALTYTASTQFLSKSSALVSAAPMSFACWFQSNSYSSNPGLVTIDNGPTQTQYFVMYLGSTGNVHVGCASGGTSGDIASSTTQTAGGWGHAAVVFASTTSRSSYCNGGGKSTNTTSVTPTGLTRSTFACSTTNTTTLAWGAIWNIALSDQDVSDLWLGAHPLKVHPEALVAIQDFDVNAPTRDLVSPTAWTVNGTAATTFNNTGIVRPARNKKFLQRFVSFAGTAKPAASSSGVIQVSRQLAGTAAPGASSSGVPNISRRLAGSSAPAMSGFGDLTVQTLPLYTLRISASGSMLNPFDSIIFAGTCTPAMVGSGVITVSRQLAGSQVSAVTASGVITVVSAKLFTGVAILQMVGSGVLTVVHTQPVFVTVAGYYIVNTKWGTVPIMYLIPGFDYQDTLLNSGLGPFVTYSAAVQYQAENALPPSYTLP